MKKSGSNTIPLSDETLSRESLSSESLSNESEDSAEISQADLKADLLRAEELLLSASESEEAEERIRLAREALDLCPLCTDALVFLAEELELSPLERTIYLQSAVTFAEELIPHGSREASVGVYWLDSDTRPFLRALYALAEHYYELNLLEEAVDLFGEILRLNPQDNQGVRHRLVPHLLELGRIEKAERLLAEYGKERSALFEYSKCLHTLMKGKSDRSAEAILEDALKLNPFIPAFLLDPDEIEAPESELEAEAEYYAGFAHSAWQSCTNALE